MRNRPHSEAAEGFNLPSAYRSHDRDTAFRLVLSIFGTSCAAAFALGAQIFFG